MCFIADDGKTVYQATDYFYSNTADSSVKWYAETGLIGYDYESKYLSKLQIRLTLPLGSSLTVSVMYDSSDTWEHLFTVSGKNDRAFTVPVLPRRCDHFRLKLSGYGDFKIFGISKIMESGGDKIG